jgi:hypothetical protein
LKVLSALDQQSPQDVIRMKARSIVALLALAAASSSFAGPPAKVADLAWMTGTWQSALGANTLEENWLHPSNGSMGSLVRMTGATGVGMWEVITIEEKDGSLLMSIQQFGKGFEARTPVAQKLELQEIDKQRVKFKAVTEGSMTSLQYSRSADNVFSIEMGRPTGAPSKLDLKPKQ